MGLFNLEKKVSKEEDVIDLKNMHQVEKVNRDTI